MEGRRGLAPPPQSSVLGRGRLVTVTVWIQVAGLMAGMVVVRSGDLRDGRVAMPLRVQIAWRVTRVVVMLAWNLLGGFVAMPVRIEVARGVAGVIVVYAGLLLFGCHAFLLFASEAH
jgi:hypothetical protein